MNGWIAVIEPSALDQESGQHIVPAEALHWLQEETARFREFVKTIAPALGLAGKRNILQGQTLLDGGIPTPGILRYFDDDLWKEFQHKFL
jgi:hypothetical protein